MKWYEVIALSVGGRRNKIFQTGEKVSEAHFPPGRADVLVKEGFLKFLKDDGEQAINEPEGVELQPEAVSKKTIEEVSIKEMKSDLKEAGIDFNKNASKQELFSLWKALGK